MTYWIAKIYTFIWSDFLMRTEPFTHQFRRMAKKWPLVWILFLPVVVAIILARFWHKIPKWWLIVIIFVILAAGGWLLLHLGGFA